MRVISKGMEDRLGVLIDLAGGIDLFNEALMNAAPEKVTPALEDIIEYILINRSDELIDNMIDTRG